MKKIFSTLAVALFLFSCGTTGAKQEGSENKELSMEEESALADELSSEIQSDTEDVQKATEETLQEVDSLLDNF